MKTWVGVRKSLTTHKWKTPKGPESQSHESHSYMEKPHVLVFDESTNSMDRDSLGALAAAIREYKGAVIIIPHSE
jgi:ABC-type arginine transport system ATPase subunit